MACGLPQPMQLATAPNNLGMCAAHILGRWLLFLAMASVPVFAGTSDLTQKQKATAKRIYDVKCAKCHRMYAPTDYAPEEWQLWARKMAKKSKLDPSKEKLLLSYLQLLGKQQSAPAATQAKSATPQDLN